MDDSKLRPVIREIRRLHERRYAEAAYFFVLEALDYTIFKQRTHDREPGRHISCADLLDGIREYAGVEFGPLALYAFHSWGVWRTEDFGELVFQMCDGGLLNARETDTPEAFADGFDFERAFRSADSAQEA
ncbi:MAG: hypothetical protein MK209_07100 [Planctomycetes bacterium]|nr:hypothetical protein [Planctomycetota bacterium]